MMMKICVPLVLAVLLIGCAGVWADMIIDFEAPTYTVGAAINGQDGWAESSNTVTVENNTVLGSQVIDFAGGVGSYRNAYHSIDSYSSGQFAVSTMLYYYTDKSGVIGLVDSNGGRVIDFGIGKNMGTPSGVVFYCLGDGGELQLVTAPAGTLRWLEVKIDVDLDSDTADMSWRELNGEWQAVFTDYGIGSGTITSLKLANSKIAAKFDNVTVAAVPEPATICLLGLAALAGRFGRKG